MSYFKHEYLNYLKKRIDKNKILLERKTYRLYQAFILEIKHWYPFAKKIRLKRDSLYLRHQQDVYL